VQEDRGWRLYLLVSGSDCQTDKEVTCVRVMTMP